MIKINSMKCGSTTHTAGMISFFVMSITDLQKKTIWVQSSTAAVNMTLLAFADDRRAAAAPLLQGADLAAIDRYLLPAYGPEQQTRRTLLQLPIAGTDRQMDGQTDGHHRST